MVKHLILHFGWQNNWIVWKFKNISVEIDITLLSVVYRTGILELPSSCALLQVVWGRHQKSDERYEGLRYLYISKKTASGSSLAFIFYSYCHFIKAKAAKTLYELEFMVWNCYYFYISFDYCEYRRMEKPLQPNRSIIYLYFKEKKNHHSFIKKKNKIKIIYLLDIH